MADPTSPAMIPFNADIGVDSGVPRPELSHNYAKAYKAVGGSAFPGLFVALVCEVGAQPRTRLIAQYAHAAGDHMPQIVNANVIRWKDGTQRMVFIFEDKFGKPIVETDHGLAMGWRSDRVTDVVVKPVLGALRIMRELDLSHGGIRPTRLFDGSDANFTRVVLGECLSAPTSSMQPVLYETIERGLCLPLGRGPSSISEDLYALGVTAAVLLRTKDVLRNPNDIDLIRAKQEIGSFAALLGDLRLTGPLLEFLRGVLADEKRERWDLEDALAWADGRRTTPKQITKRKPAARPFDFADGKFVMPQLLATEFIRKPHEAAIAMEGAELMQWVMRSLPHEQDLLSRFETARSMARDPSNKGGGADKLAAYGAIALDPNGPIRYRDLAFLPDGLGTLLSDVYARGANIQNYVDVLQSTLQTFWISVHDNAATQSDIIANTQKFEQCRSLMRNAHNPGFGLERVVYMLNPDAPCLSPMFANNYVRTPEDVVIALNEACKTSPKPSRLVDRHIIAFLAERDRKAIEMHMFDINSPKPAQSYLGTLRCLAALQRRAQMDALPELTLWMAELAKPVYATFHDRDLREEVQRRVEKVKNDGRLSRLLDTLTDPELLARDMALFANAFREYRSLAQEKASLEMRLQTPQHFGRRAGMEASMFLSAIIGFIIAAGMILIFLQKGGHGG